MKLFNTPEAPSGTADLIAPRRPPGQDMLAFRFVVERRGYKKQCKHTSKKLENDAEK